MLRTVWRTAIDAIRQPYLFGEMLVTCLIIGGLVWVLRPVLTKFGQETKYKSEMSRMHKLFAFASLYAGGNEDRFPYSVSDYDRYLIGAGRSPEDPIAYNFPYHQGSCSILSEFAMSDLCNSRFDFLPESEQPRDKRFATWKLMIGSSYNTSSRFGALGVSFGSTWNCPSMPMFWTFPYKNDDEDAVRATYFQGETKLLPREKFDEQLACLREQVL